MTLTLEIPEEVERDLALEATSQGIPRPDLAATLPGAAVRRERLNRTLDELAQFSDLIPLLPDEAFTRKSIYRDHD